MEDTESSEEFDLVAALGGVTEGSIRWRILKDHRKTLLNGIFRRHRGFDPMEDTESSVTLSTSYIVPQVTEGSIRWRILKGLKQHKHYVRGVESQRVRSDGGY